MRRFYELHVVAGMDDDTAIATVKLELLSGEAGNSFRHPMHWAAFNLHGGRDLLLSE